MKKRSLLKMISMLLAAVLLAAVLPAGAALAAVDGTIRIKLYSMGSVSRATMKVTGPYLLGDNVISKGTTLNVSVSSSKVTVSTSEGDSYTFNNSVTLKRQTDTNGNAGYISLSNTSFGTLSYLGDFTFYASGAYLTIVNSLNIEEYLYGVVGHEMSNSWPIEALKAQTVAARTYAYYGMLNNNNTNYDLVDTTADQVYKGYRASDDVVIRAVNATAGQVIYSDGKLIRAYYGASNGGETELPQNVMNIKTTWSCYVVKSDPFDIANSASNTSSVVFYSNGASTIAAYIRSTIAEKEGVTAKDVIINSFDDVKLSNPKPGTTNYQTTTIYTTATIGSTQRSYTLKFDTYDDILDYIDFGYNYRYVRLQKSSYQGGTIYYLEYCRYGHGVGLSQRGAQEMANQGYDYGDIIDFYFEGSTLRTVDFTTNAVTSGTVSNDVIAVATASRLISVRSSQSATAASLGAVPGGTVVEITAIYEGWLQIKYNSQTGYIKSADVESLSYTSGAVASAKAAYTAKVMAETAPVYSSMDLTSGRLSTLATGASVSVVEFSGNWATVILDGSLGYTLGIFLSDITPIASTGGAAGSTGSTAGPNQPVASSGGEAAAYGYVTLQSPTSVMNIRTSASTSSGIAGTTGDGSFALIYGETGDWYSVKIDSVSGYVMKKYVTGYTPMSASAPVSQPGTAPAAATSGYANQACSVYSGSSTSSSVIESLEKGEGFTILDSSAGMYKIQINALIGWIPSQYCTLNASSTTTGRPAENVASGASGTPASTTTNVNLRSGASTTSTVLAVLAKGTDITLYSTAGGWSYVAYGTTKGYISADYVKAGAAPAGSAGSTGVPAATSGVTNANVYIRSGAGGSYTPLTLVSRGATVAIDEYASSWCKVTYNGVTGYMSTSFLVIGGSTGTAGTTANTGAAANNSTTGATGNTGAAVSSALTTTTLNLRAGAGTNYESLAIIASGTKVNVISIGDTWSQVSYNGKTGYMKNTYLSISTSGAGGASGGSSAAAVGTALTTANVNLRASASTSATSNGIVPGGKTVQVLSVGSEWSNVTYNGTSGYIKNTFLQMSLAAGAGVESGTPAAPSAPVTTGASGTDNMVNAAANTKMTVTTNVNFRSSMDSTVSDNIIAKIPGGVEVEVLAQNSKWSKVLYNGREGYVASSYLQDNAGATTNASGTTYWHMQTTSAAAFYQSASVDGKQLGTIPTGTKLIVLEKGAAWCKVIYGTSTGYVLTSMLSLV